MHIPNFKFLTQFGGELYEKQTQKMREKKRRVKCGSENSESSKGTSKTPTIYVHTKFQLPSSIRRGDKEEQHFFNVKEGKIPISSLIIDLGA